MSNDQPVPSELWAMAERLSSPADADVFFGEFAQAKSRQDYSEAHARAVFNTALQSLLTATQNDANSAGEIILRHILPICFETDSPIDNRFVEPDHLRGFLATWIERYPDEQKIPLRKRILHIALDAATSQFKKAALWTILAVGLRSPEVEEALIRLCRRRDDLGDTAINCLAALSPQPQLKKQIIRRILGRLPNRPRDTFGLAIQALADARFISVLGRNLLESTSDSLLTVGLLGRIADVSPGNQRLQVRIWRTLEKALKSRPDAINSLLIVGNGTAACNTSQVISSLLRMLAEPTANPNLVYNRLKDCIRPEQLTGWRSVDTIHLKRTLTPFATLGGSPTRSMTVESHLRRLAWETALSAGITDIADWLSVVLSNETGPYGIHDILSFASYVSLDSIPPAVAQLVRERINIEQGNSETAGARIRAIQVVRAAATKEAFEILLDCGLTIHGAPLRSTGDAVGDLAELIAKEDLDFVLSRLFATCESKEVGERRMLAIVGLQRLAATQAIPQSALKRLVSIAQSTSLPAYATAAAIWSVACYQEAATIEEFVKFLIDNIDAVQVDSDVKFQSLQALLRLGLSQVYDHNILRALAIKQVDGSLGPIPNAGYQVWQVYILARLCSREPERFLSVAKDVLLRAEGQVVHVMLQALGDLPEKHEGCAIELGLSAIERTRRVLGRSFGETDNFAAIYRLAPNEFVSIEWESLWSEWMPNVRAAFADCFKNNFLTLGSNRRGIVFDLLEALLSDSTYQVRRAAARSYSRLDAERLERLCHSWIRSGQTDLRLRSAEMAQWLPPDNADALDNAILRKLKTDPEPSVRETSKRSHQDLRKRIWCTALLDRLSSGVVKDPNRRVSETYCLGRALTALGDEETIRTIQELSSQSNIPPNVQNWFRTVAEELEKNWRDVTRNWPEPWLPWSGQLEEYETNVTFGGKQFTTTLSLWCRRQEHPTDIASWGGSLMAPSRFYLLQYLTGELSAPIPLVIKGRRSAEVWLNSAGTGGWISFVGTGQFPDRI